MLRSGKEVTDRLLEPLFNMCFHFEQIHDEFWREGIVVSIFKNNGSKKDPGNYRGITLLSAIGKMYSNCIAIRLSKYLEDNAILADCQNGFRGRRSCNDHIMTLHDLLADRKSRALPTLLLFVDFKKAFDLVDHNLLFKRLHEVGIKGKFLRNVMVMYRRMRSTVMGSDPYDVKVGVMQGDPCSAILFSIFVDSLLKEIRQAGLGASFANGINIPCLAYADDIVATATSKNDMQKVANICYNWTRKWRMTAGFDKTGRGKTALMSFCIDQIVEDITLGDKMVPHTDRYKYLGVWIQQDLGYDFHVDDKTNTAIGKIRSLKSLIHDKFLPRSLRVEVYESVVESGLLYAAEIWSWNLSKLLDDFDKLTARAFLNLDRTEGSVSAARLVHARPSLVCKRNLNLLMYWFRTRKLCDTRLPKRILDSVRVPGSTGERLDMLANEIGVNLHEIENEIQERKGTDSPYTQDEFKKLVLKPLLKRDLQRIWGEVEQSSRQSIQMSGPDPIDKLNRYTCICRNRIRIAADCYEHIVVSRENKDLGDRCIGCGDKDNVMTKTHCFATCPAFSEERDSFFQNASDFACELMLAGDVASVNDLLNSTLWCRKDNEVINNYCRQFEKTLEGIALSREQPSLARLLNPSDRPLLNENVVGEVFDLDMKEWGLYRAKILEYNAVTERFMIDTTGHDVDKDSGEFFYGEELDLNGMFQRKVSDITHIPRNRHLIIDIERLKNGLILTDNCIGRSIELKWTARGKYGTYKIIRYSSPNMLHTVKCIGGERTVDLNGGLRKGLVKTTFLAKHVLAHFANKKSRRKPRGRCPKGMADNSNPV